MSVGLGNLLNIGNNSIRANQVGINVTGNNIANVNTVGYTRQSVRFQESTPFNHNPGQIGTGAYAQEVYRNFDRYLENNFLNQNGFANMWNEESVIMGTVENVFNEANRDGIHKQLTSFFNSWTELSTHPESIPNREDLISKTKNLTLLYQNAMESITETKREMNEYIKQGVNDVNELIDQLAAVNEEIGKTYNPPINNCNELLDRRDTLVRELSTLVDLRVQDRGPRDFNIYLQEGMPLLENQVKYHLSNQGPFYENDTKKFEGELLFEGSSSFEYTLEFVNNTDFRVSIDGGKTWVQDDSGKDTFTVPPAGEKIKIGELSFSFTGDVSQLETGDKFYVVPKDSIFWHEPTRDPINVSKNLDMESIGGKLGAYVDVRDKHIGKYQSQLDALAESIIWEVNRIHSQGAGVTGFQNTIGTTKIEDYNLPLGNDTHSYAFHDRLTEGNLNMHFYKKGSKEPLMAGSLNFNPNGQPVENFDPKKHSLSDVVDAINRSYTHNGVQLVTATIEGGMLQLTAAQDVEFKMGSDTSGLWAALGINTFFAGSNASDISINPHLDNHPQHINAASIDGQGEGNIGDGVIAQAIGKLREKGVKINTVWETKEESLLSYYAGIVGGVGADTRNAKFNANYYNTLAKEAETQSQSTAGVNLDEEMTQLIKFQHSYTAAAKLISTADQMFDTLLSLKQ